MELPFQPSPRLAADNRRFPFDCVLFDETIGFACIAIPKSGCTAVKRWYAAMADPGLDVGSLSIHKYCMERLALCTRPLDEAERILAGVPTLAFVRHPLERLRSAFVEKVVRPRTTEMFGPARELLEDWARTQGVEVTFDTTHDATIGGEGVRFSACAAVDYERGLTFREFIAHVCHTPHELLDAHWRPQIAFLRHRDADVLLPMSAIGDTLDEIGRRLGATHTAKERTNVTRKEAAGRGPLADVPSGVLHVSDLRPPVDELADGAIRSMIESRLADDISLVERSMKTCMHASVARLLTTKQTGTQAGATPTI